MSRLVGPVAHMIGERMETLAQLFAQRIRHWTFVECAVHAPQPLVALSRADRKRQMPRPKPRMSSLLDVRRRSARPIAQVQIELVARRLETRGVQRANRRRFGRPIHQIVKTIDEPPYPVIAAEELVWSLGWCARFRGHAEE